jgi:hypothetical protein
MRRGKHRMLTARRGWYNETVRGEQVWTWGTRHPWGIGVVRVDQVVVIHGLWSLSLR